VQNDGRIINMKSVLGVQKMDGIGVLCCGFVDKHGGVFLWL